MLIDTHLHLDAAEFSVDREAVLARARAVGVGGFIVPAVGPYNFDAIAALSAAHRDVRHAYGIHPLYVQEAVESDLDLLASRVANGDAVAVGEIGLDHFVADADPLRQEAFFTAQLRIAKRANLPVILHLRRAQDQVLKCLRRIPVRGGIAHAFNGSRQQAEAFIALGFRLGLGGTLTFPGSRRIRRLATELPLSALVLETDAPDIPPAWSPGGRSEPADILRYAEILAELRGITLAEVIEATGQNAREALGLAL